MSQHQHHKSRHDLPQVKMPQIQMIVALRQLLDERGCFDGAFAALDGFTTRTLPDGIEVGTHPTHQVGAVIAPTIAALTCAHITSADLAERAVASGFEDHKAPSLDWTHVTDDAGDRVTAVHPLTQRLNLQITCLDEDVDPHFDGQKMAGATIILQIVRVSQRVVH